MEWLSVFILAGLLCLFAQGWTITDIQVPSLKYTLLLNSSVHSTPQRTPPRHHSPSPHLTRVFSWS